MRKTQNKLTLEALAAMTQRQFADFEKKVASKDELRESTASILRAIEGIELKVSAYASRWTEDFDRLHGWMKELDGRVKLLEKRR